MLELVFLFFGERWLFGLLLKLSWNTNEESQYIFKWPNGGAKGFRSIQQWPRDLQHPETWVI